MQSIESIGNNIAFALLGIVSVIILFLLLLAWRNPVLFKMGMRNIPRRPAQSILIVIGLTLSTIIIVASFSTGDTLNYSVRRQAVAAYGDIDEIIAPPLLSMFASMGMGTPAGDGAQSEEAAQTQTELNNLLEGGLTSVLTVLQGGLPGISEDRLVQLKTEAEQEPLIDAVAGSILFPTIIRNSTTGQGEPLGFIFAVDNEYDQTFGINTIDGRAVEVESLSPGVGNIFEQASNLFGMVGALGERLGLDLSVSNVATAVAAVGSLASGVQSGDLNEITVNLATLEQMGIDTQPLKDAGMSEINLGELVQSVPGLESLLTGAPVTTTAALSGTLPLTVTVPATTESASAGASVPLTATVPLTAGQTVTAPVADSGVLSNLLARGSELFSSFNLNTLGSELDRVLGEVGLQLKQGDIYLNRLGAQQLGAQNGDVLEIFVGPIPVPFRVKAVVEEASPVGAILPVVIMRLDEAQKLLFMGGKVNNVLVSNQGDLLEGVEHTVEVSNKLRELAMDPVTLEETADLLRQPATLAVLKSGAANAQENILGPEVPPWLANMLGGLGDVSRLIANVQALPVALEQPGVAPELRSALSSTDLRSWILEQNLPDGARSEISAAFAELNQFDVIDPLSKQSILTAADFGGTLFSSLFSVFGFFSVVAGILLIFLIFVMLAAERRSEMGIARAVGVQRGHLVQMFVSEGLVYSLAAAALGVLIGLAISFAMIEYLGSIINSVAGQFGNEVAGILSFQFRVSWRSIVISYSLGVLLTFIVVTISSWRVSRLNIVAAIRDLPDESNARPRSVAGIVARWIGPVVLLALAGLSFYYGDRWTIWSLVLIGITFTLFGVMNVVGKVLEIAHMRAETAQRIVYTLIGLGLLALWIVPWQRTLTTLGALERFAGDPTQILAVFAIGGPMIITGAIMAIMFNAQAFTWLIDKLFGWIGSLTPVLKTAIAYPLSTRFRTGTAMVLFAMIMATVVVMAMVIQATQSLIVLDERESGGFTIQTSNTLLSFFDPVRDMDAEIAANVADYPLLSQVQHVGSVAVTNLEATQRDPAESYGRISFAGLSDGYIDQVSTIYGFMRRAEGFADDAAVWQALRARDDVIVMRSSLLADAGDEPRPAPKAGPTPEALSNLQFEDPEEGSFGPLRIFGVPQEGTTLPPLFVELRDRNSNSPEGRTVQVIAVFEDGDLLNGEAMQGNLRLSTALRGEAVDMDTHYMTVTPGADPRAVAQEVERAFLSGGINASVMADSFAQGQAFTRNILRLLQGFMALGLLVGIAGLGVITTRTVVERRQQVGMLRAVGYQKSMIALSFVLEASFIAITGILIGTATGIVLGLNIVGLSFATVADFTMPWGSILTVILLAYGFALLTTVIPAWQASRIYPAEALRYE